MPFYYLNMKNEKLLTFGIIGSRNSLLGKWATQLFVSLLMDEFTGVKLTFKFIREMHTNLTNWCSSFPFNLLSL